MNPMTATTTARMTSGTLAPRILGSLRRTCVMPAPIYSTTSPSAAMGASIGAMWVSGGTMRPMAPSTGYSDSPQVLQCLATRQP